MQKKMCQCELPLTKMTANIYMLLVNYVIDNAQQAPVSLGRAVFCKTLLLKHGLQQLKPFSDN